MARCGFGDACPEGGLCAPSARAGALCLKGCASDADCRASEGYACDPDRKVCALPHVLVPVAPSCPEGAPVKKSFGPALQISSAKGPGRYAFEPTAVLGKSGEVIAAYITNGRLGDKNVLATAVVSKDGAIVSSDRPFESDRENQFDPWMAADGSGRAHLVWLGFDGGRAPEKRMEIGYSTSMDGQTWSKPVAVHDEADCPNEMPGCFDKPMIAIGPAKAAPKKQALYLFYWSARSESLRVRRSLDLGKTFEKSVAVATDAYGDVSIDARGDIHVVYVALSRGGPDSRPELFGDPRASVEYTRSTDGGATWQKPITVSDTGDVIPFFFSNPQVRFDAKRSTLSVVYPRGGRDLRWDIMLAVSKDGGKKWSRTRVDDGERCAHHMTPATALDPADGRLHVAWTENRGGRGLVAYAVCTPAKVGCAKNEAVSDTPFAAYELVRHDLRWLGEYYPLLIDPKSRRLHLLWTETVDESGLPTSRIFHAGASSQ
jgi:hypothetical protein